MDDFLYRHVAAQLADAMTAGALPAGERLPSVRRLCRERGLSLATALAAYRWLEAEGFIEARPRSGYFVRARTVPLSSLPAPQRKPHAQLVGVIARNQAFVAAQNRPGIVPLGYATPAAELFPAETLRRLLNQASARDPEMLTRYPQNARGLPALQAAVARRLALAGVAVGPEEIVITHGCTEALNLALGAVTRPGDTVLLEAPTYYGLLQLLESRGLRALEIPGDPFSGPSLEVIDAATRTPGRIRAALLIPNFANPTGSLMPAERKAELARLLGERGIPLIEDDVYGDMGHDGERPPLVKHWDREDLHIACGSFSKCLSPGLRVGWIVAGRHRPQVEGLKFEHSGATTVLLQAALAGYLDSGGYDRHLTRLRTRFRRQIARTAQLVAQHFPVGTRLASPRGGFVLWVELPPGCDADRLAELALQQGIGIAPGSLFSLDGRFRHCLRLNCGQPLTDQIVQAIARLGELAASLASSR